MLNLILLPKDSATDGDFGVEMDLTDTAAGKPARLCMPWTLLVVVTLTLGFLGMLGASNWHQESIPIKTMDMSNLQEARLVGCKSMKPKQSSLMKALQFWVCEVFFSKNHGHHNITDITGHGWCSRVHVLHGIECQAWPQVDPPPAEGPQGGTLEPGPGCPSACGSFVACSINASSENNLYPVDLFQTFGLFPFPDGLKPTIALNRLFNKQLVPFTPDFQCPGTDCFIPSLGVVLINQLILSPFCDHWTVWFQSTNCGGGALSPRIASKYFCKRPLLLSQRIPLLHCPEECFCQWRFLRLPHQLFRWDCA